MQFASVRTLGAKRPIDGYFQYPANRDNVMNRREFLQITGSLALSQMQTRPKRDLWRLLVAGGNAADAAGQVRPEGAKVCRRFPAALERCPHDVAGAGRRYALYDRYVLRRADAVRSQDGTLARPLSPAGLRPDLEIHDGLRGLRPVCRLQPEYVPGREERER